MIFFSIESFSFSPNGKIASEVASPLIFSGLENLYSSNYTYSWFLRNKETGSNVRISPNCEVDLNSGVQFKCNNMSFLISSNTNELPGTKTDSGKITIETVCGCKFVDLTTSSTLCPSDAMLMDGKCCQNETISTNTTMNINGTLNGNSTLNSTTISNTTQTGNITCYIPCTKSCELYPVLKIGNNEDNSGGFESPTPFHFYPKMRITSMIPNAVILNTQRNITITGGPFIENLFRVIFKPMKNDPYSLVVNGTSNITYPEEVPVQFTFINTTAVSIVNPLISNDVGYEIYLSNHNTTFSSVSNFYFRSYSKKKKKIF